MDRGLKFSLGGWGTGVVWGRVVVGEVGGVGGGGQERAGVAGD